MKKELLTIGIIGMLFSINGYADNKMVAVYTCQDGCNVTNDKTNFNCLYPDGKNCGKATVDIFVPQIGGTMIVPNAQQKSEPVSARAAKVSRPNTLKTNNGNSAGPDRAMGGSGSGYEVCPSPCYFTQQTLGTGEIISVCMEADGSRECKNVVKGMTARAAKKTTPKPNAGNKPTGPDKAAGGDVYIRCPDNCELECNSVAGGTSSICVCKDKKYGHICEEEVTQIGAPQSF